MNRIANLVVAVALLLGIAGSPVSAAGQGVSPGPEGPDGAEARCLYRQALRMAEQTRREDTASLRAIIEILRELMSKEDRAAALAAYERALTILK